MARIIQTTSRVITALPPYSYDGKPNSLRCREFDIPSHITKADGTTPANRFAVGDVVEFFKLPKEHGVLQMWLDITTAAPSGTFSAGILKGNIGKAHVGSAAGEENRGLSSGKTGLTTQISVAIHDEDKNMVFDVDDDNDRAMGLIFTAASSANETFKLKFAIVYAKLTIIA